jgi:hypothetical protein
VSDPQRLDELDARPREAVADGGDDRLRLVAVELQRVGRSRLGETKDGVRVPADDGDAGDERRHRSDELRGAATGQRPRDGCRVLDHHTHGIRSLRD